MNDTTRNAATTDPRSEDRIREDIERDRTEGTVPYPGPAAAPLGTRREADAIEDDVAAVGRQLLAPRALRARTAGIACRAHSSSCLVRSSR